jgi:peroxiredoxin Q/BCP
MAEERPEVGAVAPDFTLMDQSGNPVTLSSFRGKSTVVLYFYPKADTPGCTVEACGFRDASTAYTEAGAVVLGVSPDTVKKQAKFAEKHQLGFQLLADEGHAVAEAYGVWKEKTFMGKKYMGVERVTFLIDKQGVIRRVFPKVTPAGHAEEVLTAVKSL